MSTTRLLMTTLIIVLGIYDLCAVTFGGVDVSISRWLESLARYPFILVTFGYILGHVWGWMTPTLPLGVRTKLEDLRKEIGEHCCEYNDKFYKWSSVLGRILGDSK